MIIKIFIGCDHVAVDLKKTIVNLLNEKNHSIEDIVQLGREIEKNVLYNAVRAHLEYKIIVYNNKTILFK